MAFFHLKKLSSPVADNSIRWNYDRTEVIADAIIHALGFKSRRGCLKNESTSTPVPISRRTVAGGAAMTVVGMAVAVAPSAREIKPRKQAHERGRSGRPDNKISQASLQAAIAAVAAKGRHGFRYRTLRAARLASGKG